MKKIIFSILCLCLFYAGMSHGAPDTSEMSAEDHQNKGDEYVRERRSFLAIEEYRQAIKQGIDHAAIYRKLGKVLYMMGLIEDAIVELEKAVERSPDIDVYRIELGILYLARDRLEPAKKHFYAALEINPGFTNVYYYLGELFLKAGDYDMAWLSAKMAKRMGHQGRDLSRKLKELSAEPDINPWDDSGEDIYLRQILVDNRQKAEDIVKKISEGELFEALASDEDGPNAEIGGYMGRFGPSELHPDIAGALLQQEAIAEPVIVETDKGFHIIQRIVPFDYDRWKKMLALPAGPENDKAAEAQPSAGETGKSFIVYAGSFRDEKNAAERVRELRKQGYPSFSSLKKTGSRGTLHNVVAGQYGNLQDARRVKEKLSENGYGSFIIEQ